MNNKSDYLVPGTILTIGILIAGAIIYTNQATRKASLADVGSSKENKIVEITGDKGIILGDPVAKVTLIEFSDFQCPFCGSFFDNNLPILKEKYIKTGKVKMIYRDFAFLGDESVSSARAARCAGEQGKYWVYHDKLFESQKGENQGTFSDINLKKFARDIGLRTDLFNDCYNSGKFSDVVESDMNDGKEAGVSGTPTILIGILPIKIDISKISEDGYVSEFEGGTMIVGAQPLKTYEDAIEKYLNK